MSDISDKPLVFTPRNRLTAINFAFRVSGYGWSKILAKAPVTISPQEVVHCTKVFIRKRSYYVLVFRGELLSCVAVSELPANAGLTIVEKPLLRFQFDWLRQNWKSGRATLALAYYIVGIIPLALGWLQIARSTGLSQTDYRSHLNLILLLYSLIFLITYYRFARRQISTAWDLRSLQIQTIMILAMSILLLVKWSLP